MKQNILSLIIGLIISTQIFGQSEGVSITTDNTPPDESAMLEIKSNNKGLLIPRMTALERINIQNPAEGLMVYQTNDVIGFYFFSNGQWTAFVSTNQITDFGSGQIITGTERDSLKTAVQVETDPVLTANISDYGSGQVITDAERNKLTNDNDADVTNEIQDLQLNGNILTITQNGNPTEIDLSPYIAGQWNETTNGINYTVDNSTIEINIADTVFKVDAATETNFDNGKNIVLKAGGNSTSTGTANGGNIILQPGTVAGSGSNGIVEVKGELVSDAGFFQYRQATSNFDFTLTDITQGVDYYELDASNIVPLDAKTVLLYASGNITSGWGSISFKAYEGQVHCATFKVLHASPTTQEQIIVPLTNGMIGYTTYQAENFESMNIQIIGWWK